MVFNSQGIHSNVSCNLEWVDYIDLLRLIYNACVLFTKTSWRQLYHQVDYNRFCCQNKSRWAMYFNNLSLKNKIKHFLTIFGGLLGCSGDLLKILIYTFAGQGGQHSYIFAGPLRKTPAISGGPALIFCPVVSSWVMIIYSKWTKSI